MDADLGYSPEPSWRSLLMYGVPPWYLVIASLVLLYGLYRLSKFMLGRGALGAEMPLSPSGDTLRYALASLVLRGGAFRGHILSEARHPFRAHAPELGLDFDLLTAACRHYERHDRLFSWAITLAVLPLLFVPEIGLPLLIVLVLAKQWRDRFVVARPYRRETFDLVATYERFGVTPRPEPRNLICYGTINPFVGLGAWRGSWSVPINLHRAAPGREGPPDRVSPQDIYDAVKLGLHSLKLGDVESRDVLFVSGTEIVQFPEIMPGAFERPPAWVDPRLVRSYSERSDFRARGYRWFCINDWNGDLVYSFLFRCVKQGDALFFEATRLALGPVAPEYRSIDQMRRVGVRSSLVWAGGAVLMIPFILLGAATTAAASLSAVAGEAFGSETRAERRQIREIPGYNYGARRSTRELMASASSSIYFRSIDLSLYEQLADNQALRSLIDLLRSRGVDTSILEEQAQTIVNNSTFVNSGTVVANSQVSGVVAGARSTINRGGDAK